MKTKSLIALFIIFLFMGFSVGDLKIIHNGKRLKSFNEMIALLENVNVVFVGEQHTDPKAHFVELELLKKLYAKKRGKIILSLEMFERDVQSILNQYLEGKISEEEFLKNSRPWKNYPTDYKPMIEFAKEKGIKVIASNVPRRYAAMVARNGLAVLNNLKPAERRLIAKTIYFDYPQYRKLFYKTMEAMGGPMGKHGAFKFKEKFYKAQCVKDSTMAESIYREMKKNPGFLILHINGSFHSDYKLGTAGVLKTLFPEVKIANVKVLPSDEEKLENKIADFIVY